MIIIKNVNNSHLWKKERVGAYLENSNKILMFTNAFAISGLTNLHNIYIVNT